MRENSIPSPSFGGMTTGELNIGSEFRSSKRRTDRFSSRGTPCAIHPPTDRGHEASCRSERRAAGIPEQNWTLRSERTHTPAKPYAILKELLRQCISPQRRSHRKENATGEQIPPEGEATGRLIEAPTPTKTLNNSPVEVLG